MPMAAIKTELDVDFSEEVSSVGRLRPAACFTSERSSASNSSRAAAMFPELETSPTASGSAIAADAVVAIALGATIVPENAGEPRGGNTSSPTDWERGSNPGASTSGSWRKDRHSIEETIKP
jgi:hypothetical protein